MATVAKRVAIPPPACTGARQESKGPEAHVPGYVASLADWLDHGAVSERPVRVSAPPQSGTRRPSSRDLEEGLHDQAVRQQSGVEWVPASRRPTMPAHPTLVAVEAQRRVSVRSGAVGAASVVPSASARSSDSAPEGHALSIRPSSNVQAPTSRRLMNVTWRSFAAGVVAFLGVVVAVTYVYYS
jgi:hypothetical protein